jgi:hypothetical protein
MKKIHYNTFGSSEQDNRLVDFLNSLREEETNPKLAENLQRGVMQFMHKLNHELLYFPHRITWREHVPPLNQKLVNLYIQDVKTRVHKHEHWRHQLRCMVWTAVLEKFRIWGLR